MDAPSTSPAGTLGWRGISHNLGVLQRWIAVDRASQMASALAYRTLLGMLPVLVVATLVFKAVAGDRFSVMVSDALIGLGLDKMQVNPPGASGANGATTIGLDVWLKGVIEDAAKLDLSGLGWVGAAALMFSAVWVVATVEDCFNIICRTERGRSWPRRVVTYWFALTAGPLLLAMVPLVNGFVEHAADQLPHWSWLLWSVRAAWSMLVLWALMLAVYLTVPSESPRFHAAAAGALVSAIGLEIARSFLHFYISRTLSLSLVYGSLGLVPVFMFWMYVIWMIVLVGLQVAVLWDALARRGLQNLMDRHPTNAST
jgi:YihY family inner membrane protein